MWVAVEKSLHKYLWAWVTFLTLLYLGIGVAAIGVVNGERMGSKKSHELRMTPGMVEVGQTPPDPMPAEAGFVPVTVGMYMDNIDNFSIRDSSWSAVFLVWFRWTGDKALDPGKNFQLVGARIDRKELLEEVHGADNTHYQRYRVAAKFTKFFNTTRVPLDDHMLNIQMEDGARDVTQIRYVADTQSSVSSRARVPGYRILGQQSVVKGHTYKSAYGDPRVKEGAHKTFSEFNMGISVKRADMGLYFKIFIGLFAGMLLTFTSFALRASESSARVSMPVGSYFGAVANSYLVGSMLPSSGQFGLVEYVSFLGLFTIFTCLAASVVSMYIWSVKGNKELSRAFDLATISTIGLFYLAINIALPVCAFWG